MKFRESWRRLSKGKKIAIAVVLMVLVIAAFGANQNEGLATLAGGSSNRDQGFEGEQNATLGMPNDNAIASNQGYAAPSSPAAGSDQRAGADADGSDVIRDEQARQRTYDQLSIDRSQTMRGTTTIQTSDGQIESGVEQAQAESQVQAGQATEVPRAELPTNQDPPPASE